jgi:hypothetical protein
MRSIAALEQEVCENNDAASSMPRVSERKFSGTGRTENVIWPDFWKIARDRSAGQHKDLVPDDRK